VDLSAKTQRGEIIFPPRATFVKRKEEGRGQKVFFAWAACSADNSKASRQIRELAELQDGSLLSRSMRRPWHDQKKDACYL